MHAMHRSVVHVHSHINILYGCIWGRTYDNVYLKSHQQTLVVVFPKTNITIAVINVLDPTLYMRYFLRYQTCFSSGGHFKLFECTLMN